MRDEELGCVRERMGSEGHKHPKHCPGGGNFWGGQGQRF